MSSPSASTDSYSSSDFLHHQSKQPAVTNMYPTSVYANYANLSTKCVETSGCGGEESSSSAASSSSDVKIYLEKFERIYNSTESAGNSVVVVEKPASTALNTFNKQQQQNRNSMTTYSYV